MRRRIGCRRQFAEVTLGLSLVLAGLVSPVAGASSQSFYPLSGKVKQGMLVSLTSNPNVVEPANTQTAKSLVGIAELDDSGGALDRQPGQISVRTDGVAMTLVSTLRGDIDVGDKIGPSSIDGIGAKVSSGWIAGTAQGTLSASTKGAIRSQVTDNSGKKHSVYVASIPLVLKVADNSQNANNSAVPPALQTAIDKIAGKHTSMIALIFSFLLLAGGIYIAGTVISSAIRTGITAIARQPLTKFIIVRKVLQAIGVAAAILVVVLIGAVLLLRIF